MALLNEKQTSRVLGCSVAALRKWRLFGNGPVFVKIGRLVRYREADLDAFITAHRVEVGH
jgi:hypothetical protein